MKKNLFTKFLALFLSGLMLTAVGCKDYDDDISSIDQRLKALETGPIATVQAQLTAMQEVINNLKAVDANLQTQLDALKNRVKDNEDAITALETAKAGIDAEIAAIKKNLEDNYVTKGFLNTTLASYATNASVAKAVALAETLKTYTTDAAITNAINAAKAAAITAAGDATKAAFLAAFDGAFGAAVNDSDSDLVKARKAYDAKIIAYLTEAINDNGGVIDASIATKIEAARTAMLTLLSGRLTSITLIPEVYIDGIETIELKSLGYTNWGVTSNATTETVAQNGTAYTTAMSATDVRYRMNPSRVYMDDIKTPSYVFEKAVSKETTRAAYATKLIDVTDYKLVGGELVVSVKKVSGTTVNLAPTGDVENIYTAALKVPLAEKHLADGAALEVYSEYYRLAETTVVPKIAALIDKNENKPEDGKFKDTKTPEKHYHFSAAYDAAGNPTSNAQAANPSIAVQYNQGLDLLTLVTGCYVSATGVPTELTKQNLTDAGLEFRFAIPTKPYTLGVNGADQQKFATITGTTITSKLPDGTTDNRAAIDKTPIVRVELIDTNNSNVVDVRYFKIQWVAEVIPSVDLGVLKTFEYTLGCDAFTGNFIWSEMVTKVLAKLRDGKGMSQDEFLLYYGVPAIAATDHTPGGIAITKTPETYELYYNYDNTINPSAAAFTWRLTTEQIGNVIDQLIAGTEVKRVVNVTIDAKNIYNGKITFSFEVVVKKPTLPVINGYESAVWHTDYTLAYVYPVQYKDSFWSTGWGWGVYGGANTTCYYDYDVNRLFADSKTVKSMTSCGTWDLQFAKTQPTGSAFAPVLTGAREPAIPTDKTGYSLKKATVEAANLSYFNMNTNGSRGAAIANNWYSSVLNGTAYEAAKTVISLKVVNNAAGIQLINDENEATVKLWASINPYNKIEITKFNVKFIKPLTINKRLLDQYFVDKVIGGSKVDCSDAFTMTDFAGYTVANTPVSNNQAYRLYKYYDVESVTWDLANAVTNLKNDGGNYVIDETITAENAKTAATVTVKDRFGAGALTINAPSNTELTFLNVNGIDVAKAVNLYIPVSVSHKWGVVTDYVTVTIYPMGGGPAI